MDAEATYRGTVCPWQCDHIGHLHEMRNAETGEVAATCETTGVHMDRAQRKSALFAPPSARWRKSTSPSPRP
jgi:hypothetical protein